MDAVELSPEELAAEEAAITDAADQVWNGLQGRYDLWKLIQKHRGSKQLGPTRIHELTDGLFRPEHVSRIASGDPPKRPKKRRRFLRNGS